MADEAEQPKSPRKSIGVFDESGNLAQTAAGEVVLSPAQQREKEVKDRRISSEQATIRDGFASQPVAGHDFKREREEYLSGSERTGGRGR